MRLIDADDLLKAIDIERKYLKARGQISAEHILVHHLRGLLENAPTVDAVEVVRCKDCKHYRKEKDVKFSHCEIIEMFVAESDYCCFGKRKEKE